ncbi:MAG: TRAP transporter substrate-binding protein, partial [Caulobacter sp.]|nr:TRAP transporter substrate-binding protein [Vitreoscilla sp.]
RADVAGLNANLQKELAAKGMTFNATNATLFRDHLRKANFYSDWKARFGEEGWAVLERSVGKLS